jgi:serine protease Do
VTRVIDGSPADNGGMVAGNIILRIDSAKIHSIEELVANLHKRKVGETISIVAVADGEEQAFEVTLSKIP